MPDHLVELRFVNLFMLIKILKLVGKFEHAWFLLARQDLCSNLPIMSGI